jgi:hypothetical protein
MNPHHLCEICGGQLIHSPPPPNDTGEWTADNCITCGHLQNIRRTNTNTTDEAFLALNQRIDTLKDALLNEQETTEKLLAAHEKNVILVRALITKNEQTHNTLQKLDQRITILEEKT